MKEIHIDGESVTIEDVVAVARNNAEVIIPKTVEKKVLQCRNFLEKCVQNKKIIYGVTTGFGALSNLYLPADKNKQLQLNLVRSHSASVGKLLDTDIVRAMMLLRANSLAKGYSGIRTTTLHQLVEFLNRRVHPLIPEKGSVGASGDLSPSAHLAMGLIGEGDVEYNGKIMPASTALEQVGLDRVELEAKEGLALINGTQMMTAISTLTYFDAENVVRVAEIASALTLEALMGRPDAFDPRIQQVKPHEGQIQCAHNIRRLISGSQFIKTNPGQQVGEDRAREMDRPVQDSYCLRCIPQVMGAVRDAITFIRDIIQKEINSASDNPLVFQREGEILFGGNFHGQSIGLAMDLLGISLTTIGNMSERRIAKLLIGDKRIGLPRALVHEEMEGIQKGLNMGMALASRTAASLASENKVLAHPASVDSIPDPDNYEDFVSMAPNAATKAAKILKNVQYIIAIELVCAAQAIDFHDPQKLGKGTKVVYELLRKEIPPIIKDEPIYKRIEKVFSMVREGKLLEQAYTEHL